MQFFCGAGNFGSELPRLILSLDRHYQIHAEGAAFCVSSYIIFQLPKLGDLVYSCHDQVNMIWVNAGYSRL